MLDKNEYFINRELSWLNFNLRVLEEAADKRKPLLERLKFIAITSSNLDEFFMIRFAGLKQQLDSGINKMDAAGLTVKEQVRQISENVHQMVKQQYKYVKNLLSELEQQELFFCEVEGLTDKGKQWSESYFLNTVFPVITPLAVDASHPFPFLANRSLNLAVHLHKERGESSMAVIQVPAVLPRIVEVPGSQGKKRRFVLLEDIIRNYCGYFFRGYQIKDVLPFRITRNGDLLIDEEEADDLLVEVEKSLRQRKRGEAVRLETGKHSSKYIREFLMDALKLNEQDMYEINGPIDCTCFMKFADLPGYEHLRHEPMTPQKLPELKDNEDLFALIREKDLLLHHPYYSFEPVVEFIRQASVDPKVLAIKQTLYRVSGNSSIVRALSHAAENGKQVTVVVEVKARFDEENNILWARRLEEAGCHVIYGLVGLKTHAKMALVVRQEENGIKRYVHMGTGNYNDSTAKLYTDMGLFTANDQFGADASGFFNMLSGYSDPPVWNKIMTAPFDLRNGLYEIIDREIAFAEAGKGGHIIAKMNSLIDKGVIMKLYQAAMKGVKIELIIRGICGLRPGIKGISHNITVRSIVGRLLEHHRILYTANDGDPKLYLSSADWMQRNLNERVELLFPVEAEEHKEYLCQALDWMLQDTEKAYLMKSDGSYRRADKRGSLFNSQEAFYRQAVELASKEDQVKVQRLQPLYRKEE